MPKEVFPSNWEGVKHTIIHLQFISTQNIMLFLLAWCVVLSTLTSVKRIGFFPSAVGKNSSFSSPPSGSSNLGGKYMTVTWWSFYLPIKNYICCRQYLKSYFCIIIYMKTNMHLKNPSYKSPQTYLTVWVPFLYNDPPVVASKKQGKHAFWKKAKIMQEVSHTVCHHHIHY